MIFQEEEYEDELQEEEIDRDHLTNSNFKDALDEEDPEVIKELITLIKRVGGLDELEKQLQLRLKLNENSPILNNGHRTTTTMSPISQSLYDKVLSSKRGNSQSRNEPITSRLNTDESTESESEPSVQRQHKENRYSSVIRNSRPRPQNDGIDKLSEIDGGGVPRERPQYVTITRTQAPRTTSSDDDESIDEPVDSHDDVTVEQEEEISRSSTTQQPAHQYVSIRRSRPTTTTTDKSVEVAENDNDRDEDEKSNKHTTIRMQYVNIQRTRPTPQSAQEEDESNTSTGNK